RCAPARQTAKRPRSRECPRCLARLNPFHHVQGQVPRCWALGVAPLVHLASPQLELVEQAVQLVKTEPREFGWPLESPPSRCIAPAQCSTTKTALVKGAKASRTPP